MQKTKRCSLLAFITILALSGFAFGQNRNTYVSGRFNYSIKYPSHYKVNDLTDIVIFSSPLTDKKFAFSSNVNVTARQYPVQISDLQEFLNQARRSLKETFRDIRMIEEKKDQVDKRTAYRLIYTLNQKEAKFKMMQILLADGRLAYALTYTALESEFNKGLKDADAIIRSFHIMN